MCLVFSFSISQLAVLGEWQLFGEFWEGVAENWKVYSKATRWTYEVYRSRKLHEILNHCGIRSRETGDDSVNGRNAFMQASWLCGFGVKIRFKVFPTR